MIKRICVFCGSGLGARDNYRTATVELADEFSRRKIDLVYGGARVGLMGILADRMLETGAHVIGVMPAALEARELAHTGLSELHIVDSMHERKFMMADLADAFIALPGGFGTLEELFEAITWSQLGIHTKPCGLLNTCDYYARLLAFLDHCAEEKLIQPAYRETLFAEADPPALLDRLAGSAPQVLDSPVERNMTDTPRILEALSTSGLAEGIPHIACGHYPKVPFGDHGQVNLTFSDFGTAHSTIQFIFRDTGEIELWACPNKLNDYQMALVFNARAEASKADLVGFAVDVLSKVSQTFEVYRLADPTEQYDKLVDIWSEFDPVIRDPLTD